jgi:simple sugar transport system permease protein
VPVLTTALVLVVLFAVAAACYPGFLSRRVIANLLGDNAFLGITAIGLTFVILSGGIDLSVGAVVAFTATFVASSVAHGWHPLMAAGAALMLGLALGAVMGGLIHAFALPPFLVTLGGMFLARGMAFVVSMESVGIDHPLYARLLDLAVPLGGRARLSVPALVFLVLVCAASLVAGWTRFGRNVYAVGGSEASAVLMGLPVGRTKVLVYTFSGWCSALAGVVATLYMGSGNPAMGVGLELDAIAAVVIGGTLLSGGVGGVVGTLFGVLIFGTIQMALVFDGRLNSWWLRIAVGVLLLLFILLQRALGTRRNAG